MEVFGEVPLRPLELEPWTYCRTQRILTWVPRIDTLSYDSQSKQVLMEVSEPHSLVYGPLCTDSKYSPHILANLTKENIAFDHEEWGDCLICQVGAFTLHHSRFTSSWSGNTCQMALSQGPYKSDFSKTAEKCPDVSGGSGTDKSIMSIIKCSKWSAMSTTRPLQLIRWMTPY